MKLRLPLIILFVPFLLLLAASSSALAAAPQIQDITFSSPTITADLTSPQFQSLIGTPTNYTITMVVQDADGVGPSGDLQTAQVYINEGGANAGQYRGWLGWARTPNYFDAGGWGPEMACSSTGGPSEGYASWKLSEDNGSNYTRLAGCSIAVNGNQQVVNFVINAATIWGSDGPWGAARSPNDGGNDISGYVRDYEGNSVGFTNYDLNIAVNPNPRIQMSDQSGVDPLFWSGGANNTMVLDFGEIVEGTPGTKTIPAYIWNYLDNDSTLNWTAERVTASDTWFDFVNPATGGASGSSNGTSDINTLNVSLNSGTASLTPGAKSSKIRVYDPWAGTPWGGAPATLYIELRLLVTSSCADTPPDSPTLFSPANGAVGVSINPTLDWNGVSSWGINCDGNNNRYEIYLDTSQANVNNKSFSAREGSVGSGTTSYGVSGLSYGTTYYWRIVADNGALEADSPVWQFTTEAAPVPILNVSPTILNFSATQGGANPADQGVSVWNSNGGTLSWTAGDDRSWISILPTSYTGNSTTLWTSIDISGMSAGAYSGTITVAGAAGTQNSPQTIAVNLTITEAPVLVPEISVDPSSLTFGDIDEGDSSSESLTFEVWNSGDAGSVLNWTASETASWFKIDTVAGSSTGPADVTTVTVTLDNQPLAANSYNGDITISDPAASNDPQTVTVSLTVNAAPPPPPILTVSPTTVTFTPIVQGTASTETKFTFVWNSGGGTLNWSASESTSWFSILPVSGQSTGFADGDSIWVTLENTAGLAAGTYAETITVSGQVGTLNSPQTVTVQLEVAGPPVGPVPAISVDPSILTFTAIDEGDTSSESLTFAVWNSGDAGSTLNWSATVTWNAGEVQWFTFSPASGSSTGPADVETVTVTLQNTAALVPDTYTKNIVISDPAASNDPQTVTVSLTVNVAPPPPPPPCESNLQVVPTSRSFSATEGGSNPAEQSVLVWDSNCFDVDWLATPDQSWITVVPGSGRAFPISTTSIFVDITGLSAGVYTGTVTYECDPLSSCSVGNQVRTVDVTLTITAATGTISGYVYEDTDTVCPVNGSPLANEPDIVSITGPLGTLTTGTDASGHYEFTAVPYDAYQVTVRQPAGWSGLTCSCANFVGVGEQSGVCSRTVTVDAANPNRRVDFSILNNPTGWFQVRDGDVYGSGLSVTVPDDVESGFERWFHADGSATTTAGGVTIAAGSITDLSGNNRINERTFKLPSYTGGIPWPQEIDAIDSSHPGVVSGDIVYATDIDISTDDPYPNQIVVAGNSITIRAGVTRINSLLISKGTVLIEDGAGDDTLTVNGGIFARGSIDIQRELSNNKKPALLVNYNPHYVLLNIPGLTRAPITWKEVR